MVASETGCSERSPLAGGVWWEYFLSNSVDLKCEDPEVGCPSSGQCSVGKLLVMWQEAGIKTFAPRGIKSKIDQLLNEYENLRKSKKKYSEAAVKKRND